MVLDRVNSGVRGNGERTNLGATYHGKRIQAGLSTQIVIQVADDLNPGKTYVIGAVQSLGITQSRTIGEVREVGTDGLISLVPTGATTYSVSLERIVFDFQRLPQALQREYRNIHAQRRPFDIVITDYNPYLGQGVTSSGDAEEQNPNFAGGGKDLSEADGKVDTSKQQTKTILKNCWFESLEFTYRAENWLITETARLKCEHIYDTTSVSTVAGKVDSLERRTNTAENASVMSAYDAKRVQ